MSLSPAGRTLAVALWIVLLSPAANADIARFRLVGQVDQLSPGNSLAGISIGDEAVVVIEIDGDTPGTVSTFTASYTGAVKRFDIEIGDYLATLGARPSLVNLSLTRRRVDSYIISVSLEDDEGLGSAMLSLSSPPGTALSDLELIQDLDAFETRNLDLGNTLGNISIVFDEDVEPPPPEPEPEETVACRRAQIGSAGAMLAARFICAAKGAKKTAFDAAACIDEATRLFVADFDAAREEAEGEGLACASTVAGNEAVEEIADVAAPLDDLIQQGANPSSKPDRKYRSAIYRSTATAVETALRAYSKDAKKPNADKLRRRLVKNEKNLRKEVKKAAKTAKRRGIAPNVNRGAVVDTLRGTAASAAATAAAAATPTPVPAPRS